MPADIGEIRPTTTTNYDGNDNDNNNIGAVGGIPADMNYPFPSNPFMGNNSTASTSMEGYYGSATGAIQRTTTNDNNLGAVGESFDELLDAAIANFLVEPLCDVPEPHHSPTESTPKVKFEPGMCYYQFDFYFNSKTSLENAHSSHQLNNHMLYLYIFSLTGIKCNLSSVQLIH